MVNRATCSVLLRSARGGKRGKKERIVLITKSLADSSDAIVVTVGRHIARRSADSTYQSYEASSEYEEPQNLRRTARRSGVPLILTRSCTSLTGNLRPIEAGRGVTRPLGTPRRRKSLAFTSFVFFSFFF